MFGPTNQELSRRRVFVLPQLLHVDALRYDSAQQDCDEELDHEHQNHRVLRCFHPLRQSLHTTAQECQAHCRAGSQAQ